MFVPAVFLGVGESPFGDRVQSDLTRKLLQCLTLIHQRTPARSPDVRPFSVILISGVLPYTMSTIPTNISLPRVNSKITTRYSRAT
jgi:hypothetical protein